MPSHEIILRPEGSLFQWKHCVQFIRTGKSVYDPIIIVGINYSWADWVEYLNSKRVWVVEPNYNVIRIDGSYPSPTLTFSV